MRTLALIFTALIWTPAVAEAQVDDAVAIKVRGPSGKAVPSKIYIRRNGVAEPTPVETDANGERVLPKEKCDNRLELRAKPNSAYFAGSGQWLACSGSPMVIAVSQSAVTFGASAALAYNYPPAMAVRRDSLQSALNQGDSDAARLAAYDLAVFLRQSGKTDLSTAMTAIVVDQSTETLASAGVSVPEQALVFDVEQQAYVSTPETLAALEQFQVSNGIRAATATSRPQWNLRTIRALSGH